MIEHCDTLNNIFWAGSACVIYFEPFFLLLKQAQEHIKLKNTLMIRCLMRDPYRKHEAYES